MIKVTRMSRIWDFSSAVALDHNELWRSLVADRLSVTFQMLLKNIKIITSDSKCSLVCKIFIFLIVNYTIAVSLTAG